MATTAEANDGMSILTRTTGSSSLNSSLTEKIKRNSSSHLSFSSQRDEIAGSKTAPSFLKRFWSKKPIDLNVKSRTGSRIKVVASRDIQSLPDQKKKRYGDYVDTRTDYGSGYSYTIVDYNRNHKVFHSIADIFGCGVIEEGEEDDDDQSSKSSAHDLPMDVVVDLLQDLSVDSDLTVNSHLYDDDDDGEEEDPDTHKEGGFIDSLVEVFNSGSLCASPGRRTKQLINKL